MGAALSLSLPLVLLAVAAQATFVPQIRFLGGGPDLVLLMVVAWSVNSELEDAVVWAFVGGIMQDLLSAAALGTSVVGLLVIVFGVHFISRQVYRIGLLLILVIAAVGTVIQGLFVPFILTLTGFRVDPLYALVYVGLPTLGYNAAFIWPVYGFIRGIQRRFYQDERIFTLRG